MLLPRLNNNISLLENLNSGVENTQENEKLSRFSDKFSEINKKISDLLRLISLFKENDLILDLEKIKENISDLEIISNSENLQSEFRSNPKSDTLVVGNFRDFEKKNNDIYKLCFYELEQTWNRFISECYGGEKPFQLESVIIQTPENKRILNEFNQLYNQFKEIRGGDLRDSFDDINSNKILKLSELGKNLKQKREEFNEDYPDEVKEFLNQITTNHSVPLSLYTDIVKNWIEENNFSDHYLISLRNENQ